jgi:hypothetical protein
MFFVVTVNNRPTRLFRTRVTWGLLLFSFLVITDQPVRHHVLSFTLSQAEQLRAATTSFPLVTETPPNATLCKGTLHPKSFPMVENDAGISPPGNSRETASGGTVLSHSTV